MRATATVATFRPRRPAIAARFSLSQPAWPAPWAASTAAQRTRVEPCLVIGPRRMTVSDSRCRGVSPADPVVFQLEALLEARHALPCVQVGRDDLVAGGAQLISSAHFHRPQPRHRVK